MSALVWDATGTRFYETGVSRGVLYPQNSNGEYGTGVAWNGLTGVTESPDGAEANDMYADNIKYASLRSAETFGGTIEAYTYPDEFAECDGSYTVTPGVYIGQQSRKAFGFCYRTEVGNDTQGNESGEYKLHIVYGATASPSEKSYETINDSPDAITLSWEITTIPTPVQGHKATSLITIDTSKLDSDGLTALASLEELLYGTASSDPELPSPDEVIAIFAGTATYATLTAITISDATLAPTFASDKTQYTATTSSASSTVTVTAESNAVASVAVNGSAITSGSSVSWSTGMNVVKATVTKNGSVTNTYTVNVYKS